MSILPRTHWLFATLIFFNDSNLVYCCLKNILCSSNLSRILRNPKFINQPPSVKFFVCPSVFRNNYIDWGFFSLFSPKWPNNPTDCLLFLRPPPPLILVKKLNIDALLIHHINLQFCCNYIFYFHSIVSIFNFTSAVSFTSTHLHQSSFFLRLYLLLPLTCINLQYCCNYIFYFPSLVPIFNFVAIISFTSTHLLQFCCSYGHLVATILIFNFGCANLC